jgi:hypothetical protein
MNRVGDLKNEVKEKLSLVVNAAVRVFLTFPGRG